MPRCFQAISCGIQVSTCHVDRGWDSWLFSYVGLRVVRALKRQLSSGLCIGDCVLKVSEGASEGEIESDPRVGFEMCVSNWIGDKHSLSMAFQPWSALSSACCFEVPTRLYHVVPMSEFLQVGGKLRMFARRRQQNQEDPRRRIHQLCWAAQDDDSEMEMASKSDRDSFLERLGRAWSILFPPKPKSSTNAEIAKQRLRMILISDRCSVNDDAKRKILNNIVGALSDFVEIESEDKVQLNVTSDPDLGTVYSVTVPVRRVRPEYQEFSNELMNTELRTMEYMEGVDGSLQMVDFRFEHPDAE